MIISPRPARLPVLWITCGLILLVAIEAFGQAGTARAAREPELLNSQRIERTFGSYGIEILESDTRIRVSNLHSTEDATRVCRTFAVVRYPDSIAPAYAAEHAAIVSGGSIGAVFAASGWTVEKFHRHYGRVLATSRVATLMHVAPETTLAIHAYALDIVKDGVRFHYATIVEVHHPAFLTTADLPVIYGPLPQGDVDADTTSMLDIAAAKMRGDR